MLEYSAPHVIVKDFLCDTFKAPSAEYDMGVQLFSTLNYEMWLRCCVSSAFGNRHFYLRQYSSMPVLLWLINHFHPSLASEELTIAGMTFTTFDLGGHEQGKTSRCYTFFYVNYSVRLDITSLKQNERVLDMSFEVLGLVDF